MAHHRNLRIVVIKSVIIGRDLFIESSTVMPLAELARRGHDVTFFASATSKSARKSTVLRLNLEFVQLPKRLPLLSFICFELAAFRRLLASIAHVDVIILDPNSVPMLFPVVFLRRLCSPTPVLLLHVESNVVSVRNPIRVALLKFVDVLSTKLASISFDKILYSTPMMGELYRELYEVPAEKISVWPNSVELSFSESSDATRTGHLRRQLGLVGRFGFLYHGALREGILELVEAFRILHASSVNVILVILGYGVREVVARYIQEHNLQEIVKLRGPVEHAEVPTYIAACDAGIVPLPDNIRWRYQNPIKILELLAMNKPIIVSDIPAHRWIIGNAPVAFYLRGTDPVSIAEGVRGFLALHDKLDPTRGQKIVQERFTPERVADILEKEILSRQTNVQ